EEIKDKSLEFLAKLPFSKLKEVLKSLLNYIEDLRVENEKSKSKRSVRS
ncbi:MAG: hypothetical protein SCARUB_04807, partial [Candidatus Scalindua rubra]